MNELQYESSPYLLQHAQNPVYWKAWNDKNLELAKESNKLIIVSIGYSTCHWCHVMEHESFENKAVATLMNESFISIKVDREERPDVDAYYMKAVQLMNQRGGWPLNVICLPDGRPVWGGTYFRKQDWMKILTTIHELYQTNPDELYRNAESLSEGVLEMSKAPAIDDYTGMFDINEKVEDWVHHFDRTYGGYGRPPKFMIPNSLLFLQRYAYLNDSKRTLEFVDLTLTRMAWGGLFDTVQGGFSRYSVDKNWHIPHFEKMLYDNAQLLSLYADGYKRTKNPLYKEVIEKTVQFMIDEWSNGEGGFYAAYDADSLNEHNQLKEGAYYSWTKHELEQIIEKEDFPLFKDVFNINNDGYWEDDVYVLIQTESVDEIASRHSLPLNELVEKKVKWEELLRNRRSMRAKPRLDDKTLTSWNALLIIGLLDAYTALDNKDYLFLAERINQFIHDKLLKEQKLKHTYKNEIAGIEGFLEDYACYIAALIALYEHTLETSYLLKSKELTDYVIEHFLDSKSGFFFFNNKEFTTVLHNSVEIEDGVIPSANSQMANNLLKLGVLFEDMDYISLAENMLEAVKSQITYPPYYSNWLIAAMYLAEPSELLVSGANALSEIHLLKKQLIGKTFVFGTTADVSIPYFAGKYKTDMMQFYLCTNRSCMSPQPSKDFLINQKL